MGYELAVVLVAVLLISTLLTIFARKLALSRGVLDVPNERSSHLAPTPRGGGAAIVISSIAAWLVLVVTDAMSLRLLLALSAGGIAVAVVGLLDDRFHLSPRVRLVVQFASALSALVLLGGLPAIQFEETIVLSNWVGSFLGTLGIVWTLNLFNFMDGIDGIAGSEATFVVVSGALITLSTGVDSEVVSASLVLGAACFGFLLLNWPPAKIFMGDVGSGYLGYVIAVLAIAESRTNPVALFVWLTLGGVFFVDATVTLIRRLVRGERVYEAHRSHAYQWLARRWNSHSRVTVLVILINLFWLLPLAWGCVLFPYHAWWISLGSLVPLIVLALLAGAGRPERISVS